MVHAVVLGDVHLPWGDPKALQTAATIVLDLKPSHIVQIGDLVDAYFASRYPKTFKLTPQQEYALANKQGAKLWRSLQLASPKSKCWQLWGNHCERVFKKLADKVPELTGIVELPGFMQFEGVTTTTDARDALTLKLGSQSVTFIHGYLSKLGDHCKKYQTNIVCGHSHRPGIVYERAGEQLIWEANAGYLGDETAPVFKYGESNRKNWGRGVLVIDDNGPRFVSFEGNRSACTMKPKKAARK